MMSDRCKNCGAEQDEHYDGVQCPIGQGLYSSTSKYNDGSVEWRVSPQVFSDLHTIIAKHGMGLPGPYGINPSGPDAAALEIIQKYNLRPFVPLKVIVDYSLTGCEKPEYEEE